MIDLHEPEILTLWEKAQRSEKIDNRHWALNWKPNIDATIDHAWILILFIDKISTIIDHYLNILSIFAFALVRKLLSQRMRLKGNQVRILNSPAAVSSIYVMDN